MPTIEEEEIFFGKYFFSKCQDYNETIDRRACIINLADMELKKFNKVGKGLMGFTIACAILSLLFFMDDDFLLPLSIFIALSVGGIYITLPFYASGVINRKPYKQVLKENKQYNFGPLIGLSFASIIIFILSYLSKLLKYKSIGLFSYVAYLIVDIALIVSDIKLSHQLKKETIPVLKVVANPLIGLIVPHFITFILIFALFILALWLGDDAHAPVARTLGLDSFIRYPYRFMSLISLITYHFLDFDGVHIKEYK